MSMTSSTPGHHSNPTSSRKNEILFRRKGDNLCRFACTILTEKCPTPFVTKLSAENPMGVCKHRQKKNWRRRHWWPKRELPTEPGLKARSRPQRSTGRSTLSKLPASDCSWYRRAASQFCCSILLRQSGRCCQVNSFAVFSRALLWGR